MNNLWVYGDSFSVDMNTDSAPCFTKYVEYKKRQVKSYSNFIGEKLNLNVINKSVGGSDNYTIFETLCEDIEKIEDNDLVILNWGPVTRFRIVNEDTNRWESVMGYDFRYENFFCRKTIEEISINRLNQQYENEILNFEKIIRKSLRNNFLYIWTWTNYEFTYSLTSIEQETNGHVKDGHWAESGHKDFSESILRTYHEWKMKQ